MSRLRCIARLVDSAMCLVILETSTSSLFFFCMQGRKSRWTYTRCLAWSDSGLCLPMGGFLKIVSSASLAAKKFSSVIGRARSSTTHISRLRTKSGIRRASLGQSVATTR